MAGEVLQLCQLDNSVSSNFFLCLLRIDKQECQRTIKWLCDYVEYQAKQPAPFHSRDLHSMMVAAFNCLLTWITHHPWLLDDQVGIYP